MLIRSQDKKLLINLDLSTGLSVAERKDKKSYSVYSHGADKSYNTLGTFSTEEKAIKALDMIQNHYDSLNMYHNNLNNGYISTQFTMPTDEEVKVWQRRKSKRLLQKLKIVSLRI